MRASGGRARVPLGHRRVAARSGAWPPRRSGSVCSRTRSAAAKPASTSPKHWWTSRSMLPALLSCSGTAPLGARASAALKYAGSGSMSSTISGERRSRGRLVDRRHRGDRLAAIAHLVARQRIFVLRDRQHAVGAREVLAGDDGAHARQRARLARVDRTDHAVRDRAAQDAPDQRVGERQVGGVARAAGDLLDAVDQRRALADAPCGRGRRCGGRDCDRTPPAPTR